MAAKYSFDTSAFIEPLKRHHTREVFPTLWDKIDDLIANGSIVSADFVKTELARKDDDIYKYVKSKEGLFIPFDSEQKPHVDQLMKRFPNWIPADSTKNVGDPFVIALAKQIGLTVVTYEERGNEARVRMPYARKELEVPCLHFVAFLNEIGYRG